MKRQPNPPAAKNVSAAAANDKKKLQQHPTEPSSESDAAAAVQPVSLRTHIALAVVVCSIAFLASYTGLIAGGRENIDALTGGISSRISTIFNNDANSDGALVLDGSCAGHGVAVDNGQCFCDLGWTGDNCAVSMQDVEPTAVQPNSILYVVESFGDLVASRTARTTHATLSDVATIHDAAIYETLAEKMAAAGALVTVLYTGELSTAADSARFNSLVKHYAQRGVDLIALPAMPSVMTSASESGNRAYAVYRYLTTPGMNVYATVQAPVHSGVLHYVLQARHQGLACFAQTRFIAHVDSMPRSLAERLAHGDLNGAQFGKAYGGSETQITEMLRVDYMSQSMAENSDLVVVGHRILGEHLRTELRWKIDPAKLVVAQEVPAKAAVPYTPVTASSTAAPLELVFVGTPQLSMESGLKLMLDAIEAVGAKLAARSVSVTFLGHSVELTSPTLASDEYIQMRGYSWPAKLRWQTVHANSVGDILAYMTATPSSSSGTAPRKLAVLPYVSAATGTTYLLNSLLANGIPFTVARDVLSESAVLYDDWDAALFAGNSTRALATSLLATANAFGRTFLATRASSDVAADAARLWAESVYSRLFTESAATVSAHCAAAPVGAALAAHSLLMGDTAAQVDVALPMVTVVIVHHDRVELVKQAIRSIEEQTYPQDRIEVILVDDGSSDAASIKFINDLAWQWWESKGWKVIREPQRWLGAARNTGAANAKGEFLLFLDDDDVAKPHKLETMVNVALTTGADIVTSGHDLFHSVSYPQTGSASSGAGRFVPLGAAADLGLLQNGYGDSSFLAKRSYFDAVDGFTEDFGVGFEDYEFLARAALMETARVETVPEALMWYRKLNAGTAMTENTELKQNQVRMMRPYVAGYATHSVWTQNLLHYAQSRLFERGIDADSPFAAALLNTTTTTISFSTTTTHSTTSSIVATTSTQPTTSSSLVKTTSSSSSSAPSPTPSSVSSSSSSAVSSSSVSSSDEPSSSDTPTSTVASSSAVESSSSSSDMITSSAEVSSTSLVLSTTEVTSTATSTIEASSSAIASSSIDIATSTQPSPSPTPTPTCVPVVRDCAGRCPLHPLYNTQQWDACGVCGGDGSSCLDCLGVMFGSAQRDNCGVCQGDNSQCNELTSILPNPVVHRAGVFVVLAGAGFRPTDRVYINRVLIRTGAVFYNSSSAVTVLLEAPTPFDDYFNANPNVSTANFPVQMDFGDKGLSSVRQLSVYRDQALVTGTSPNRTVLAADGSSNLLVTITGTGFINYAKTACWFKYTALQWNDDFTAQEYRTLSQSTKATYYSPQLITCPGPQLDESSDVEINLSFSGIGYDKVGVGASTFQFPAFQFVPVAPNTPHTVRYVAAAPAVVATWLDDAGVFTYVSFDAATNGLELANTSCQALFDVDPAAVANANFTYAQLSTGLASDCRALFLDPYTLAVTVSADFAAGHLHTAPAPGLVLRMAGGVLKKGGERFFDWLPASDSLPIAAPVNPVSPAVELVAGQFLGACSGWDVDLTASTGGGGRYFTFANYSVQIQGSGNHAQEEAALNAALAALAQSVPAGNLYHTVPAELFSLSGTYLFTFVLGNFLGPHTSRQFQLQVDTAAVIPVIRIQGPNGGRALPEQPVKLMALLKFTANETCLQQRGLLSTGNARIAWSLLTTSRGSIQPGWASASGAELVVPPYAFQPGYSLLFEVAVTLPSTGQTYRTQYQLQYDYSQLVAVIRGGNRQLYFDSQVVLRARLLDTTWRNQRQLADRLAEYQLQWACALFSSSTSAPGPCIDRRTNQPLQLPANAMQVQFSAGSMMATPATGYYAFTLQANHTLSGRSSQETVQYRFSATPVPAIQISTNSKRPAARDPTFSLFADIIGNYSADSLDFIWVSQPRCNGRLYATLNLTDPSVLNSVVGAQALAFRTAEPPALQAGQTYCVEVLVRPKVGAVPGAFGRSAAVFSVRQEPDFGSCRVLGATTGQALSTEFVFRCGEWSTDPLSGSIWYTFYERRADGTLDQLALRTKNGVYRLMFARTGVHTVVVDVTDEAGGRARSPPVLVVTVTDAPAGGPTPQQLALKSSADFDKDSNAPAALQMASLLSSATGSSGGSSSSSFVRGAGNHLRKRDLTAAQQSQFALLGTLSQKASVDHQDVGPMLLTLLQGIVAGGQVSIADAVTSVALLGDLLAKMNAAGRDSRTCFTPAVAGGVLAMADQLYAAVNTTNATLVADSRHTLVGTLTGCMQRRTVCGGKAMQLVSAQAGQITLGSAPASSTSQFGLFSVPRLGASVGAQDGECLQYFVGTSANSLLYDASAMGNSTVDDMVYVLEFRNETVNNGGPAAPGDTLPTDQVNTALLSPPVTFTIPLSGETAAKVAQDQDYVPSCTFFKRLPPTYTTGVWDTTGCTVASFNASAVTCQCTHLTEFAIRVDVREKQAGTPPSSPPPPSATSEAYTGLVPGAIAGIAFAVCAVLLVAALVARRIQVKHKVEAGRVVPVFDDMLASAGADMLEPIAPAGIAKSPSSPSARADATVSPTVTTTVMGDNITADAATTTTTTTTQPATVVLTDDSDRNPVGPPVEDSAPPASALPAYQLPPSYDEHVRGTLGRPDSSSPRSTDDNGDDSLGSAPQLKTRGDADLAE